MKLKATVLFISLAAALMASPIEISNDWLRVIMDDTTGMFTIGKTDGTPLLDGFPTLGGSHFIARIGYSSYSNRPGLGLTMPLMDPGQSPEAHYMSIQWFRDPVRIWQKFYFLPEDSLDGFVNIEYLAYNDSPDSAIVGFALYLDITCGTNDNPILELPTGIRNMTVRYETDLPAYWTFYENSVHQETTYTHSQGVPFGSSMLYPTEVYFGNSGDFEDAEWFPSFLAGLEFTDMAVYLMWEPILITPYSWFIIQSYYGVGYPGFGIREYERKPRTFALGNPRPNPFNARVSVPVTISDKPQHVSWNIYDLTGRIVKHSDPEVMRPGEHRLEWDCRDEIGREMPAGMYLLAFWADGVRETKRLVYVK
ncbi:MAG TPA: T9SS type A sorting domain-containing protein [candidate division Zixibacteria bacterium]|nr:T9SS type A sorting domain-containing protein [candidate division Zixibacteria bacterium]